MSKYHEIKKFWDLAEAGKSAALDINDESGDLVCRFTKSVTGEEGNGVAPIEYTDQWIRVAVLKNGEVTWN